MVFQPVVRTGLSKIDQKSLLLISINLIFKNSPCICDYNNAICPFFKTVSCTLGGKGNI